MLLETLWTLKWAALTERELEEVIENILNQQAQAMLEVTIFCPFLLDQ